MIIRRETIQAALAATTADNSRYFFNGVLCEPDAARLIGTNGHVMLIATDKYPELDEDFPLTNGKEFPGNPATPVVLPAEIAAAMLGTMVKKPTIPILACAQLAAGETPEQATIAATDLRAPRVATLDTSISPSAHKFPTYEKALVARPAITVPVVFAVEVLERLIKAAKAVKSGARANPLIQFDIPIQAADRYRKETRDDHDNIVKGKPQHVMTAVGITIHGDCVDVTGLAMPFNVGDRTKP